MKIKISILAFLALLISSCQDQLNEKIYGTVVESDYWKTEADLKTGLASAYGKLMTPWNGFSKPIYDIEEMGADYTNGEGDFGGYSGWSSTFPSIIDWGIYGQLWQVTSYCNKVIDKAKEAAEKTKANVPGYSVSDNVMLEMITEARFIRAFDYYTIVNWFGGVPLVTSSTDYRTAIPKQTSDSINRFVENELKAVIELLPTKTERMSITKDYGRITKGGAQALLARVYIQQKKWQECADITTKLYTENLVSNEYKLEPNYKDIFTFEKEGYNNSEVMWALAAAGVVSGKEVNGSLLQVYLYKGDDSGFCSNYYTWGGMTVTRKFYDSFDKIDKRRELLVTTYTQTKTGRVISLTGNPIMEKFPADPNTNGSLSGNDYIVIRWADVLLMRAEALNELGQLDEALRMVNLVRDRAGVTELVAGVDLLKIADKKTLSALIYAERRWEFYFEGQGRTTMKRFNTLLGYIMQTSKDAASDPARYLLLPFPASAVIANPLLYQNRGYK